MPSKPTTTLTVLAIVPDDQDQRSLRSIVAQSNWRLYLASNLEEGKSALDRGDVGVIITDTDLPDGCSWKQVAQIADGMAAPPNVIVSSGSEDARLWAEVLNLGGFDVLTKPFGSQEVCRSVSMAWRCRRHIQPYLTGALRARQGTALISKSAQNKS